MKNKNIYLIGAMGVGKTSLGKKLAKRLNLNFYDSDLEIMDKTGVSIPHIFDLEGEKGFRKREKNMIAHLCQKKDIVLATGGGVVLNSENTNILTKTGIVIYLKSSIEQLVERTLKSKKSRPLLDNAENRYLTIKNILDKRESLYENSANLIIDVTGKKPYQIIDEIIYNLNLA